MSLIASSRHTNAGLGAEGGDKRWWDTVVKTVEQLSTIPSTQPCRKSKDLWLAWCKKIKLLYFSAMIIDSNYARLVFIFLFPSFFVSYSISCQRHPWETEQDLLREPRELFFSAEITNQQRPSRLHTAENVSVGPPEKNTKPHGRDEQVSGREFTGLPWTTLQPVAG